jgi:FixJ family two-component response regulator
MNSTGIRNLEERAAIVYVVDDDPTMCRSLEGLIRGAGWEASVCASAEEFLSRPRAPRPCCLVLDPALPGLSGLDLQSLLAGRMELPIIFLSTAGDIPTVVRAMKAGAIDFLTKPFDEGVLLNALGWALDRSRFALRRNAERQVLKSRYACLTRREQEVMALVITGRLSKRVGLELGITEATVKVHRANVMRKMKTRSLADLVRFAARLDLAPASAA